MQTIPGTPYLDFNMPINMWRNNLPHWEQFGKIHFVTFRLADSMPQSLLSHYRQCKKDFLRQHPFPWSDRTYKEYHELVSNPMERYIDNGYGECILSIPRVRQHLINAFDFYDGIRYTMLAYVIMPNHVHSLMTLTPGYELYSTLKSILTFSARKINIEIGRKGSLWQPEPFDTIIRNHNHYVNRLEYIRENPHNLSEGTYAFGGLEFITS